MAEEMIIFTRVFDLLDWLLPKSEKFPRPYRFTLTQRIMNCALDVQDFLCGAQCRRGRDRYGLLLDADAALNRLRVYMRLVYRWNWINDGQYRHVSEIIAEIGRMLGGWIKQNRNE